MSRSRLCLLPVVIALVLSGCGSDVLSGLVEDQLDRGSLSATVDGAAYQDTVAYMELHTNTIKIYAARRSGTSDADVFELVVSRVSALPGTVELDISGSYASYRPGQSESDKHATYQGSGHLTVTSFNGQRCIGTFNFQARDLSGNEITVTNGTFDVSVL